MNIDCKPAPRTWCRKRTWMGDWLRGNCNIQQTDSRPVHFVPGERDPGAHWSGDWVGPREGLDIPQAKKPYFLSVEPEWKTSMLFLFFFFRFVSNIGDTYGSALLLHMLTSTVTLTLLAYQATKVCSSPCLLCFVLRTMIPLHSIRFPGFNSMLLLYKHTEKLMRWTRHAECM